MHQFAHHGADDTHLALSALLQTLRSVLKELTASDGCDRRKVQRTPEPSIADL